MAPPTRWLHLADVEGLRTGDRVGFKAKFGEVQQLFGLQRETCPLYQLLELLKGRLMTVSFPSVSE